MIKNTPEVKFDMDRAKGIVDAFAFTSGVRCVLYTEEGYAIYEQKERYADCSFCRKLCDETGVFLKCDKLHSYGAFQSERFGGRYIYSCPAGMTFSASPIISSGKLSGALVCGPVMITDADEILENDTLKADTLPRRTLNEIRIILDCVPELAPTQLSYVSNQLYANASFISDSVRESSAKHREDETNSISEYILQLNTGEGRTYPADKEHELFTAVSRGDKTAATTLLNEILGHIYFYTGDPDEIRDRIVELFIVLSRAAIFGGANADQILRLSHRYMHEMRAMDSQSELTGWLASSLNRFIGLVFNMLDVKHTNVMHGAVEYINANYANHLSLDEVAENVGYSAAYFSTIFKEEMGKSFKEYLNEIRIEKSKSILLSSNDAISHICTLVGFNDQSYFCKMFKQQTGVSPDKFRKRVRMVDSALENA